MRTATRQTSFLWHPWHLDTWRESCYNRSFQIYWIHLRRQRWMNSIYLFLTSLFSWYVYHQTISRAGKSFLLAYGQWSSQGGNSCNETVGFFLVDWVPDEFKSKSSCCYRDEAMARISPWVVLMYLVFWDIFFQSSLSAFWRKTRGGWAGLRSGERSKHQVDFQQEWLCTVCPG